MKISSTIRIEFVHINEIKRERSYHQGPTNTTNMALPSTMVDVTNSIVLKTHAAVSGTVHEFNGMAWTYTDLRIPYSWDLHRKICIKNRKPVKS